MVPIFHTVTLKGSTLVFSLIVLAFLLVSTISLAVVSVSEKRASLASAKTNLSFQAADSGAEAVLAGVKDGDAENVTTPGVNVTLDDFFDSVGDGCSQGKMTGGNATNGKYEVMFYDENEDPLDCTDNRVDIVRIVSKGTYAGTTRAIDVGIPPVPLAPIP